MLKTQDKLAIIFFIIIIFTAFWTSSSCGYSLLQETTNQLCPSKAWAKQVTPRALGTFVAMVGPWPVWAAVALNARAAPSVDSVLLVVPSAAVYTAFIQPVRYLQLCHDFDPSGHTFVVMLQLLDLLMASVNLPSTSNVLRRIGYLWTGILFHQLLGAVGVYHTVSEVFIVLVPLLIYGAARWWLIEAIHRREISSQWVLQQAPKLAVVAVSSHFLWTLWLVATCPAWSPQRALLPMLFDTGVLVLAGWLLAATNRNMRSKRYL